MSILATLMTGAAAHTARDNVTATVTAIVVATVMVMVMVIIIIRAGAKPEVKVTMKTTAAVAVIAVLPVRGRILHRGGRSLLPRHMCSLILRHLRLHLSKHSEEEENPC
jgi:hypothetical protein